jgi:hypothetical protein
MDQERERFLNLRHLPARMNAEEVAIYFRMSPHEIPILVAHGLLKPLGNPVPSSVKFFATVTLQELHDDTKWLHRATGVLKEHWRIKNAKKSSNAEFSPLRESTIV